ncbi:MAG: transcriptional repressor [Proteobacteria bacterium]|nr:transcriptional repressor [Pseudomonadota bacterium]
MDKIAEDRLRAAGLRVTKHRICVLACLLEEARPLSHLDLIGLLREQKLDRVTVYRILALLKDSGLVHQVQGTDGIWRFCAHEDVEGKCPGGHPHLLCEVCGQMTCLSEQKLPHLDVPHDFKVTHKQMLILGICANCQKLQN